MDTSWRKKGITSFEYFQSKLISKCMKFSSSTPRAKKQDLWVWVCIESSSVTPLAPEPLLKWSHLLKILMDECQCACVDSAWLGLVWPALPWVWGSRWGSKKGSKKSGPLIRVCFVTSEVSFGKTRNHLLQSVPVPVSRG